ncbi:MAG: hypothetical protein G5663_02975 [Serratia symbiotica]|nr:hypothetical protein [Serratia symbiotica]
MPIVVTAHIELLVKDSKAVPEATSVENWLIDPDYTSIVWVLVDIDVTLLMGKAEKLTLHSPLC